MDRFELNERHFCDVPIIFNQVDDVGQVIYGTISHQDHPSFLALREHLHHKGYIECWWGGSNGDHVLREFMLNDRVFSVGDRFPCAAAQRNENIVKKEMAKKKIVDYFPDCDII